MPKTSSTVTALTHARRKPADLTAYAQPVAVAIVAAWVKAVGGRDKLVEALLTAPTGDPRLDYVIGLLADPAHDARAMAEVCALGGVTLGELIEGYKRGILAGPQAHAIGKLAAKLPEMMDDLLAKAVPYDVPCGSCNGVGKVSPPDAPDAAPVLCRACNGTGAHRRQPDLETQKVVLEMGKLTSKGGAGVLVQTNHFAPTRSSASPAAFGSLMAAVDRILHPGRPSEEDEATVDADVIAASSVPTDSNDTILPTASATLPVDGSAVAPPGEPE